MLAVFVGTPWLALVPALAFGLVYALTRRRAAVVAAFVWLAYFLYEEAMRRRILCTGECNIRVDLLLLYPMLLAFSLFAAVSALRRKPNDTTGTS